MTGLREVPVARLHFGANVRAETDDGLVPSVREHGVLTPITVAQAGQDASFEVLVGHRRARAATLLGLETIPAVVIDRPANTTVLQLVENLERRGLDPIDAARALRGYLDEHPETSQADLARSIGRSPAWVSRKLELLKLGSDLAGRLAAGEIPERQAYDSHLRVKPALAPARARALPVDGAGRTRSVVIPLVTGKAVLGVDRDLRLVDLVVNDGRGHSVAVDLDAEAARLLGLRLTQAWQAVR